MTGVHQLSVHHMTVLRSTPPIRNMIQKPHIQQELHKMSNGIILNKRLNMNVKSQQQKEFLSIDNTRVSRSY